MSNRQVQKLVAIVLLVIAAVLIIGVFGMWIIHSMMGGTTGGTMGGMMGDGMMSSMGSLKRCHSPTFSPTHVCTYERPLL